MKETLDWLRLSNYQAWPESGGWAEQDAFLVEDVKRLMALEQRQTWEVEHGITAEATKTEGALKVQLG